MLGRDGIAGILCLGLSIAMLVMTRGLPQSALVPIGPDFYPRIVLGITAVLSAILVLADVYQAWRRRGAAVPVAAAALPARNYKLVTLTFVLFALYVALLPFAGYRIATFLFVAAQQVALEPPTSPRRWSVVVITAIATSLATYLVFEHYLQVLLPRGTWTGM